MRGGGGQRGRNPGEKGARSAQGVELKEDAESGIPMVAAIRRNQKITQHCVTFCNRKKKSWKKKQQNKTKKKGLEPQADHPMCSWLIIVDISRC